MDLLWETKPPRGPDRQQASERLGAEHAVDGLRRRRELRTLAQLLERSLGALPHLLPPKEREKHRIVLISDLPCFFFPRRAVEMGSTELAIGRGGRGGGGGEESPTCSTFDAEVRPWSNRMLAPRCRAPSGPIGRLRGASTTSPVADSSATTLLKLTGVERARGTSGCGVVGTAPDVTSGRSDEEGDPVGSASDCCADSDPCDRAAGDGACSICRFISFKRFTDCKRERINTHHRSPDNIQQHTTQKL
jgi:hypothetical protein